MGTLTAPKALSAPTPACAASVSIDRFRFNFVPSFASDEIHDVAPFPLRRFLLLPGEVGERPPVQNRFDGFGRLLDQPRHGGGGLLVNWVPLPLPAGGLGHRTLDGPEDLRGKRSE